MLSTIALRGRGEGAAPVGVEARFGDAIALDPHRDAHEIATRSATGGAGVWVVLQAPFPVGACRCSANDRIEGNGNASAAPPGRCRPYARISG